MFRMANWISLRISFSSISILTISNGKRSWKSLKVWLDRSTKSPKHALRPPKKSSTSQMWNRIVSAHTQLRTDYEKEIHLFMRAPPLSSLVETSFADDPSMDLSMSTVNCWTILQFKRRWVCWKKQRNRGSNTYWRRAFVFRPGSFGWKFLYSATSFSNANNFFWRLSRSVGRVSLNKM